LLSSIVSVAPGGPGRVGKGHRKLLKRTGISEGGWCEASYVGLLITTLLVLRGRHIANRLDPPPCTKPIDPLERRKFDGLESRPRSLPVNHLCLEEADDGFGECVVIRVTAAPDGRLDARR
jgi:hypothetical protein